MYDEEQEQQNKKKQRDMFSRKNKVQKKWNTKNKNSTTKENTQ